ncbi:unnamed protein product, partial [Ectocarpus fasciculatus]
MFISLGGVNQLLRLFEAPISTADARSMSENGVKRRAEVWNEVMVMLREVMYSTPLLADRVVTSRHIVFIFTMLHHQSVFENSMNLLEEILATILCVYLSCMVNTTFPQCFVCIAPFIPPLSHLFLSQVPALYSLVGQFSTRQMAHFCRVLALLLFESEDRQIMESSKVLKSFELLNLRKDRMTRASFNIVELNQSLVIGMPSMLHHLIVILQVLNYGPTVSEYVRHNVSGHVPLSSDILTYLSGRDGRREWKHFSRLHQIASSRPCDDEWADSNVTARPGWGSSSSAAAVAAESTVEEDDRVMRDLLNAFSANSTAGGSEASAYDPISNILNVMQVAHSIGIAPNGVENYDGVMQMLITMSNPDADYMGRQQRGQRNSRRVPAPGADDSAYYNSFTAASARHELQFHAMVLAPHQVEVLFVMCTLLCGRRKLQVQNSFAKYGLPNVLWRMNTRMSWDAPPYEGPNPYEHIHGPSCECNPESALRVQFLRLVHNFYDRDFMNNELKSNMLAPADVSIIILPPSTGPILLPADTGLMGRLATTLMKEPRDSVYQFWLCSGAECFLRGQTEEVQIFFARCGLLKHLVRHVINHNTVRQTESVLQTSLDLIGEMVKYNQVNIELLQISMLGDSFSSFVKVLLDNIIDSNVFLRSLYLSIEDINAVNVELLERKAHMLAPATIPLATAPRVPASPTSPSKWTKGNDFAASACLEIPSSSSYLIQSWYQYSPSISSENEINSAGRMLGLPGYQNSHTEATSGGETLSPSRSPHINVWLLPPEIQKVSTFLLGAKTRILLRLMSIVTLRSINHENICCMNTAVLILMFDYRRGILGETLAEVRHLAENSETVAPPAPAKEGGVHSVNSYISQSRDGCMFCKPYYRCVEKRGDCVDTDSSVDGNSGLSPVLLNFRLLLWYWTEYYFRRGRDRLSLEFSSHIPFSCWRQIVGVLCADDGSPTSLVSHRLQVPESPYAPTPPAA